MADFTYDVVIPTHGRAPSLLDQTLRSVVEQTLPPSRVIVVVDGHPEAAERLAEDWPGVDVLRVDHPRGGAVARDVGIRASAAPWVCFVDDDDLWPRWKMRSTADFVADRPECAAVRAPYMIFADPSDDTTGLNGQVVDVKGDHLDELEQYVRTHTPKNDFTYLDIEGDSLGLLLERNRGVIGSSCVRRSVLHDLPPVPEGTRPGDDHVLFCLVATRAEWMLIPEVLLLYRLHAGQDSRSAASGALGIIRSLRAAWELCGEAAPRTLQSYGRTYRHEIRGLIWPLLRAGRFVDAVHAYREARSLLPGARDRALVLIPAPLVWRWRRWQRRRARSGDDE